MGKKLSFGWRKDYPDFRDYNVDTEKVSTITASLKEAKNNKGECYLGKYCTSIKDQGDLGSCTSHAAISMVEFHEKMKYGTYKPCSRLFLYKVTRNLMKETGDTGAYLRTTMGALTLFGTPPEDYCEYNISEFDNEPSSFLYSFAQNFQSLIYFKLDGTTPAITLQNIKKYIENKHPVMFGFTVYDSIYNVESNGVIPIPKSKERVLGGHAVLCVGFNAQGLIIQNSWGKEWGNNGFGILPYWYIENGVADDFWTVTKQEYVDITKFE